MKYINKINDTAFQRFFLTGNKGQRITLTMRYMPFQEIWVSDIEYLDFKANGIRIVDSLNILRPFRRTIPFGLLCASAGGADPTFIDDFTTQRSNLYLLDETDVDGIETAVFSV